MNIKWALSQILPYRSANRVPFGKDSAADCVIGPPRPLTATAGSREIVKEY
jgi:hypothetical protein